MAADLKQRSLWEEPPPQDHKADLRASFERRVLRGLAAEWENACWLLPENIRRAVKKPIFAIHKMPRRLGTWHPDKCQITLSRDMVADGRWDDIREVLLHEMAHQVAHEALKAGSESDHGPGFMRACAWLSANPAASGAYRSLRDRLRRGDRLDADDRMAARIHKLMALAESSNPHEAHAAMRKAYELIARHNVDLIEQGRRQDYTSIFLGTPRVRHFREAYHLAHLLQNFYFVQGVWVEAWVLDSNRMGRVLEISGSPRNVQIADYVHDAVNRYIDAAWEDYREGPRLNRYRKTDFAVGVVEGFAATLQDAAASTAADSRMPVRMEDQALTCYVSQRYPHVRRSSRRGPGHDAQVLADGTRKGRQLVIAKGISQSDGYRERKIEYKK
ncbi:MAG TPA: DUF2786 domain-containing protein [Desulfosarcina sp.]|nr:DUF2786 domain-containing protein [Desulfosarcina sp.]